MAKSLQDYRAENSPKTKEIIQEETMQKKYRAIDAFYMGIIMIVLFISLRFISVDVFGRKIETFSDYIKLREQFIWASLIERGVWAYVMISFANKLNKQPLGWVIFAFLIPYLALIIIGLSPKVDNNFYEYESSRDKEKFFSSLSLADKLKLYKYVLIRAKLSANPQWFLTIKKLNSELFPDEQKALEALQCYEEVYNTNFLTLIKSHLPSNLSARADFLKTIEPLGINE